MCWQTFYRRYFWPVHVFYETLCDNRKQTEGTVYLNMLVPSCLSVDLYFRVDHNRISTWSIDHSNSTLISSCYTFMIEMDTIIFCYIGIVISIQSQNVEVDNKSSSKQKNDSNDRLNSNETNHRSDGLGKWTMHIIVVNFSFYLEWEM